MGFSNDAVAVAANKMLADIRQEIQQLRSELAMTNSMIGRLVELQEKQLELLEQKKSAES